MGILADIDEMQAYLFDVKDGLDDGTFLFAMDMVKEWDDNARLIAALRRAPADERAQVTRAERLKCRRWERDVFAWELVTLRKLVAARLRTVALGD